MRSLSWWPRGALALALGSPAGARLSTAPAHHQKVGAHALVDEAALAGATCRRDSEGGLEGIKVRWPVVFARAGRSSQVVGWRVRVIEAVAPYEKVFRGRFVKATATPTRNARFSDRYVPVTFFVEPLMQPAQDPLTTYVVVVDMRWYGRDGGTVTGHSSHFVSSYRSAGEVVEACSRVVTPGGTDPTVHADAFGAHALYDETYRPGAVCRYDDVPVNDLAGIRVHWPVMFAGAGRTSQVVGWRFRVRRFDGAWTTVRSIRFVKATATPRRNARFSDRSVSSAGFPETGPFEVWVDMRWYGNDGVTVVGSATHRVLSYEWRSDQGSIGFSDGCGWTYG